MPYKPGDKFGKFELLELISDQGGFGNVWLVKEDTPFSSRKFALKILRAKATDDKSDIRAEAENWANISFHPNVAPFVTVIIEEDSIGFVSHYIEGGNLREWLAKNPKDGAECTLALSCEEAIAFTIEILEGVEHIHSHDVVHRDLKPENILVCKDTPILIDFGLSRLVVENIHTRTQYRGTPTYSSPEALNGSKEKSTDIWSTGVILYELLRGNTPFFGSDMDELISSITYDPPRHNLKKIPKKLREVVFRSLQKDPRRRFASAKEMREALEELKKRPPRRQSTVGHKGPSKEALTVDQLQVESHKFVPMFVGRDLYSTSDALPEEHNKWTAYKKFQTDLGNFYVLPYGVGVWHIVDSLGFDMLTDLALWRRKTYQEIKSGRHQICDHVRNLTLEMSESVSESFRSLVAQVDYVLSLFVLKTPKWTLANQIDTALRVLCCPTPLQAEDIEDLTREDALLIETELLKRGFQNADIREFGLPPNDVGYASWAGVSYFHASSKGSDLVDSIIDLEIAVQGAWFFASCIKNICLNSDDDIQGKLGMEISLLIRNVGKIKSIGSTEPMAVRTMHEAVVTTSRLEKLADDTVDLYKQLID